MTNTICQALRELTVQTSFLNRQVSDRLSMRDVDLGCLDVIARVGPLTPSALARTLGLHPATLTGILDRLEKGDWISRERDPADRRGVVLQARPQRATEILTLYAGMNGAIGDICDGYSETELRAIADFLTRTTDAGRRATDALLAGGEATDTVP